MKFDNIEQFCEGLRACGSNEDRHQLLEDTSAIAVFVSSA